MDKEKKIEELKTFLFEKSNSANVEPVFTDESGEEHYLPDGAIKVLNDILEKAFIPFIAEEVINAGYGNVEQAVREFAEKLKDYIRSKYAGCETIRIWELDQLIKERFGKEV